MLNVLDRFLNSITMYRLLLYYLILLLVTAFIYSIFRVLPFSPIPLLFSSVFLVAICFITNKLFEKIFAVQTNIESLYITALILACIITPARSLNDYIFLFIAGVVAMSSKYILAIKAKHIFNPAAIAVVITALVLGRYASWWIGTLAMLPFSLVGALIVRKIRRFDLVFYFIVATLATTIGLSFMRGNMDVISIVKGAFIDSPILFFGFIMLTEPLTTPPTKLLQSMYGVIVGILFSPIHFGVIFTSPEIALTIGNIFSYIVSPKEHLILTLQNKLKLTNDIYDFVFAYSQKLNFKAGQYMEWTMGHKHADSRGNRRYFTISSSPTENNIRIAVKLPNKEASSFKNEMVNMKIGHKIIASQLAGDFVLPKNASEKLVFIAGGIGITPFRSMIKYLIDKNENRNIVLIYCERDLDEMIYKDIFNAATEKNGIKLVYFETDKKGHMQGTDIMKNIPDYLERTFYLSGPQGMVKTFEETLKEMKLNTKQIVVDYFPGY